MVLAAACWAFSAALCLAEPVIAPPPVPEPATATVVRGGSVDIVLKAGGRVPAPPKFLIRVPPRFGTLGEPRATGRTSAVITYTQTDPAAGEADSFRFAAQVVDSPVSIAATVSIRIQQPPARLEASGVLDFGEASPGKNVVRELRARNVGGSPAMVTAAVDPPWRIEGNAAQKIPPGGGAVWRVVFQSDEPGTWEGAIRFSGVSGLTTLLSARATRLIEFLDTFPVELSAENQFQKSLRLRNPGTDPLGLRVSASEGLDAETALTIPGNSEATLTVSALPGHLREFTGNLTLSAGGAQSVVPVRVLALPAHVVLVSAAGVTLSAEGKSLQPLVLENQGGMSAQFSWQPPAGLIVTPDPASVVLAPGQTMKFFVSWNRVGEESSAPKFFAIHVRDGGTLQIPLRYPVEAVARRPTWWKPTQPPAHAPPPAAPADSPESRPPGLPVIEPVSIVAASPGRVEIAWPISAPAPARFEVQFRALEFVAVDAPPRIIWRTRRDVSIQATPDRATVILDRLPSDSLWFVRILGLSAEGREVALSGVIRIASSANPSHLWILWWLLGVVFLGAPTAWVLLRLKTAARSSRQSDLDRIRQLENSP